MAFGRCRLSSRYYSPSREFTPTIAAFLAHLYKQHLAQLFGDLLAMTGAQKSQVLDILTAELEHLHGEPWDTVPMIAAVYSDNSSLFSPLLLNLITLQPGQAMFCS